MANKKKQATATVDPSTIKATEVRRYKLAELQQLALELGVSPTMQIDDQQVDRKKDDLRGEVLEVLAKHRRKSSNDVKLTDEMLNVINDETITRIVNGEQQEWKSEKMRRLYDLGMPTAQIARELGVHYSYVHGRVKAHIAPKSEKVADRSNLPEKKTPAPVKKSKKTATVAVVPPVTVSAQDLEKEAQAAAMADMAAE